METAYIIHQSLIARTNYDEDLLDFGIFGSVDSAVAKMQELAEIAIAECGDEEYCYYTFEKTGEFENTEFEIHPDYDKDDELYKGCEDYRQIIQLSLKPVKFIP